MQSELIVNYIVINGGMDSTVYGFPRSFNAVLMAFYMAFNGETGTEKNGDTENLALFLWQK